MRRPRDLFWALLFCVAPGAGLGAAVGAPLGSTSTGMVLGAIVGAILAPVVIESSPPAAAKQGPRKGMG